jgi:hypothetical protein
MKASEFDKVFDEGNEEIIQHFDVSKAVRPGRSFRRVNVDFPVWMIEAMDSEAQRLGVTRQSLIKMWLAQMLDEKQIDLPAEKP